MSATTRRVLIGVGVLAIVGALAAGGVVGARKLKAMRAGKAAAEGFKIWDAEGTGKDRAGAVPLFQAACNDGSASGCTGLALAFGSGVGIEKDAVLRRRV